ncbi:MAG TPA: SPFH domain-containing protein [Vicinamibacterales bacterium]|nr:SPFH domain-containing protein [Vicinamibacterales bacterium]
MFAGSPVQAAIAIAVPLAVLLAVVAVLSVHRIGPNQVGLVIRRWGPRRAEGGPVAFQNEAGYQADLLMPGVAVRLWPVNRVEKHPWVQIPTGEIGLVIAQVGAPLPTGWKSGVYKPVFGQFTDVRTFVAEGGQQGVQRPVLPPGAILPLHPVAFLVLTRSRSFGLPVNAEYRERFGPALFGLEPDQLTLKVIAPARLHEQGTDRVVDVVGIVETLDGEPLPSGDIACRIGRFDDVRRMEVEGRSDAEIADVLIGNQNERHNNYQDYQKFLDSGGRIGLQHDPLLYGSYALNPYLVRVQTAPMLVVRQGEVAVIKAAVGQPTEDTSGDEFKFGSIVRPGHRGIWEEPLRTGKYAINPRIYQAEMVPTAILTLNWAEAASQAHNLDKQLKQIVAKSKEGFVFNIDLQVQIHVSDKLAPKVISMVGTMQNLVNEVLQAVVGNYFRDTLQGMAAVQFIENRAALQSKAQNYIADQIRKYNVETRGVYIQDVVLPEEIVRVLTQREIANQEKATFLAQREAQLTRIDMEKQGGLADRQRDLAGSEVEIIIKENRARARRAEGEGEAAFIEQTGRARGAEIEAIGLARAKGFAAQSQAIGPEATSAVNVVAELVKSPSRFVPDIMVTGSGDALSAGVMGFLREFQRRNGDAPPR